MPEQDSLTVGQAAEALGYSPQHTRKLLRDGTLRGVKHGRDWLVSAGSVEEHIGQRDTRLQRRGRPRQGAGARRTDGGTDDA